MNRCVCRKEVRVINQAHIAWHIVHRHRRVLLSLFRGINTPILFLSSRLHQDSVSEESVRMQSLLVSYRLAGGVKPAVAVAWPGAT